MKGLPGPMAAAESGWSRRETVADSRGGPEFVLIDASERPLHWLAGEAREQGEHVSTTWIRRRARSDDAELAASGHAAVWWRRDWLIMVLLAGLAVVARLALVRASGGFRVTMGYDDGVYFAAVNALLHGMVPYQDFVLVHPPGILVIGSGPVWLAHLAGLGDSDTLVVVRGLYVGIGALNTVLAFLAGRHLSRPTGIVAASLYAVWLPMIREERTLRLEAVVALGVLTALAVMPPVSNRAASGWWRPVVAGLVGALAASTKVWALVPIGVIIVGLLVARRWRWALIYVGTGIAGMVAILGPFFMAAGSSLWDRVIADQMTRPRGHMSPSRRISGMLDAGLPVGGRSLLGPEDHMALIFAAACVAIVAVVVAVKLPVARIWVALLVVQGAVLMAVPVYFTGYSSFVGPAGLLVAGAGFHLVWHWRVVAGRRIARGALAAGVAVGVAAMGLVAATTDSGWPVRPRIQRLVAGAHCVATDAAIMLALTNTLSTNLDRGCRTEIDFTGAVLGMDRPTSGKHGSTALRRRSREFQRYALDYFGGADVVIIRRADDAGLTDASWEVMNRRAMVRVGATRIYLDKRASEATQPDQK